TIYDIARVAGVSKSTVSRVLNKQTNISPEAREKVLRAIEELQYQPNKLARALTSSGFEAIMEICTSSTKITAGKPLFSESFPYNNPQPNKTCFYLEIKKDPQTSQKKKKKKK
ncbi:helix-turn-helix transcriptional regulator, partial [Escherichia coli]|uniref:helix-turn-helix transcriptional regulator n=1 Tax=Escherichia coli TaxID=562 RepID=UPI0020257222